MTSFESYLKNRKQYNQKIVEKLQQTKGYIDPTIYKPARDASGNATILMRFLPNKDLEQSPIIKTTYFNLDLPKGKLFELSPRSVDRDCPIWDYYINVKNELSNDPDISEEEAKKIIGKFKPYTQYWSNVLILKDKTQPECEGKVFKFSYGWTIKQIIDSKIFPGELDEKLDVFDPMDGADFKLDIKTKPGKEKYPSYDLCEFRVPKPLYDGNVEKISAIWDKRYNLSELVSDEKIKNYNELKKKFYHLLGESYVDEEVEEISLTSEDIPDINTSDSDIIKPPAKVNTKTKNSVVEEISLEDDDIPGSDDDIFLDDEKKENVVTTKPLKIEKAEETNDISEIVDDDDLDDLDLDDIDLDLNDI